MNVPCPMCGEPAIHEVAVVLASPDDFRRGLMGWANVILGPVRIDGISIRRAEEEDLRIRMPARKDAAGRLHATVMPVEPELLQRIEAVVLDAYCAALTRAAWRKP